MSKEAARVDMQATGRTMTTGMELTIPDAIPPRCIKCGYDLRGRAAEDLCPECGQPVAPSLAFRGLRHAGVEALRRLRRRTRIAAMAYPMAILLIAVAIALPSLGIRGGSSWLDNSLGVATVLTMLSGVLALGTWRPPDVPGLWRRHAVLAWLVAAASVTAFVGNIGMASFPPPLWLIVVAVAPAIFLMLPIHATALLAAGLARAIPARQLAKLGSAAAWCMLGGIILFTATNVGSILGAWRALVSLHLSMAVGSLLLLLAGLAGVCTVTILLHRAVGRILADVVEAEAQARSDRAVGRIPQEISSATP